MHHLRTVRQKASIFLVDRGLAWVYLLALVYGLFMTLWLPKVIHYDSFTYPYSGTLLLDGEMPQWRTPVYSLVAWAMGWTGHLRLLSAMQWLLLMFSLRYLYLALLRIGCHRKVALALVCIYVFTPRLAILNLYILGESLCMALTVFLLYAMVNGCCDGFTRGRSLRMALICILLVMTRPSTATVLIGVAVVAVGLAIARHWRQTMRLTAVCAATCGVMLGYCALYKSVYGVFAPSMVVDINRAYLAGREGMMEEQDPGWLWYECVEMIYHQPQSEVREELDRWYDAHPGIRWQILATNLSISFHEPLLGVGLREEPVDTFHNLIDIPFTAVYWLMALYSIWLIWRRRSLGCYAWLSGGMLAMSIGCVGIAITGGMFDFGRLVAVNWPIFLAILGQLLSSLRFVTPSTSPS